VSDSSDSQVSWDFKVNRSLLGWLSYAASVGFVLIAVIATYLALSEAYGSGPPYFGRTQNMDKWSNPIPVLAVVDLVCVAAAVLLWRAGNRLLRSRIDAQPGV